MTDLRQAAQQALEALEGWDNYGAWVWPESALEQSKQNTTDSIAALREALAQPEQKPVAWGVFEGNLHDMFFTQEEAQEMAQLKGTHAEVRPLYTTPPAAPVQEPHKGLSEHMAQATNGRVRIDPVTGDVGIGTPAAQPPAEWEWINNILHEYGLQAIDFVADWKAAQRPWQGLTDEEVQFYIKKHSKLVNAGYDKMTDTNLVAKTFDNTGFYKEVSAVLKGRNT